MFNFLTFCEIMLVIAMRRQFHITIVASGGQVRIFKRTVGILLKLELAEILKKSL